MRDVKERFKSYSLFKKVLFFNAYAIALGVCYFIIMILLSPIFDDISFNESLIYYFNDFGSYLQSALWGYTMVVFTLFTPFSSGKEKE